MENLWVDDDLEVQDEQETQDVSASQEVAESLYGDHSEFLEDIQNVVIKYIDMMFDKKMMYCGGPIPERILHSPPNVLQVLHTDICYGIDKAYDAIIAARGIENSDYSTKKERKKQEAEREKLVLDFLASGAKKGIPKCFIAGLLLMYLEFVEGVKVG